MSFRRKFARRDMSHIEKTAQSGGNRNIRRNRHCAKSRHLKFPTSQNSPSVIHFKERPQGVT